MNPTEISLIIDNYCKLASNDDIILDTILNELIESMKSDEITHLNTIECGIAFCHDQNAYTIELLNLIERYLSKFQIDDEGYVHPPKTKFMHNQLYNLIFPNLYNIVFENKVKYKFQQYYEKLVYPMQVKVYDQKIYGDKDYELLKSIEQVKYNVSYPTYEFLKRNSKSIITKKEESSLQILLANYINYHITYHNQLEADIKYLVKDIPQEHKFLYAPVKSFQRSLIKVKEKIYQNYNCKFPMNSLKDISRGSFVFGKIKSLVNFYDNLMDNISSSKLFEVMQVKNMFLGGAENQKYDYKDVKIILLYKASIKLNLILEIQLILNEVINIKKILHKFYDITRTDFNSGKKEFLSSSQNYFLENVKYNNCKWDKTNIFNKIYYQGIQIFDFGKEIIEKIGKECEVLYKDKKISDSIFECGSIYIRKLSKDDQELYSMFPYNSRDISRMISFSKSEVKNISSLNYVLYKGDEIEIWSDGASTLKINALSFRISVDKGEVEIGKFISLFDEDKPKAIGNLITIENEKFRQSRYEIYLDSKTKVFKIVAYNHSNFKLLNVDYISDYDISVYY